MTEVYLVTTRTESADACFGHTKSVMAVPSSGSALARLREYVLRATIFLSSVVARTCETFFHESIKDLGLKTSRLK